MTDLDWISFRAAQSYPLADEASGISLSGNPLPPSFLLDVRLLLPSKYDDDLSGQFYISAIQDLGTSYSVVISYANIECAVCTGISKTLQATTPINQRTYIIASTVRDSAVLQQYPWMNCITGNLCAGITSNYSGGSMSFDIQGAKLHSTCINFLSGSYVEALQVDGSYLTGVVTLQAGDGVSLSVEDPSDSSEGKVVRISINQNTLDLIWQENIADFQESLGGTAVKTINGIAPDERGNITIDTADCVQVDSIPHGIVLSNPCAKPCCNVDDSVADLNTSIKIIQEEHKTFRDYWVNMANVVNYMQANLSTLMNQR